MDAQESVQEMLGAAARHWPGIEAVTELDPNEYEIALADDRAIVAEYEPATARLVLTVEIGRPPEARRAEVLETLFAYNLLWRETGGVRAGSSGPDEPVLLMVDLFAFAYDSEQIAKVIEDFAGKAAIWAGFVTSPKTPPAEEFPADAVMLRI